MSTPTESDHNNTDIEIVTPDTDSSSRSASQPSTVPLSVWIATGFVALLIAVFVCVSVAMCCIMCRHKEDNKSPKSRKSTATDVQEHHYDYIDSEINFSMEGAIPNHQASTVMQDYGDEGWSTLICMKLATKIKCYKPLSRTDLHYLQQRSMIMNIKTPSLPHNTNSSVSDGAQDDDGLTQNAAYMSIATKMTTNVAYPAVTEKYEISGEYIFSFHHIASFLCTQFVCLYYELIGDVASFCGCSFQVFTQKEVGMTLEFNCVI